jgi:UDP-N-acetylmuramoylalanine--D-glutamate ligase
MKTIPASVLVVGFARTGQAVARTLCGKGASIVATDDVRNAQHSAEAGRLGIDLVVGPTSSDLLMLAAHAALVVVSPGVAPRHPIFRVAPPGSVVSEIELAFRLSRVPIVAITGTDGKTSVTSLVTSMLERSGLRAKALGNIGVPLIASIDDDELDVAVVEVSSFQLAYTNTFRPVVGTWLNVAEDHLDWHADLADYVSAKAKIWAFQGDGDVAVANADDPVVMSEASRTKSALVTFGRTNAAYHLLGDEFMGPEGEVLATLTDLPRAFPHDKMNALAALATARAAGATAKGCQEGLRFAPDLSHRIALVGSIDGVEFFNDSKATTPSAVCAALAGFSSVVLIAGGRNKGLDLRTIRRFVDANKSIMLRGVIAIGEASGEVAEAFRDGYEVELADSMHEAVSLATGLARFGDVVLLSPGCASFDWYLSYEARGDDFTRCVLELANNHTVTPRGH